MLIARLGICLTFAVLAFAAPAQAIVGGTQATRSWPQMAALEFRADDGRWGFRCGASLVRPEVVLTAAHCVEGHEAAPERFRLLLGTSDRQQGGERIAAVQVLGHPSYDRANGGYDVALLKLSRAALLGAPIALAGSADADRYQPGDVATIIGWGASFALGSAERKLREAQVPIRSDAECARSYTVTTSFDPATMICAGHLGGGADSCQGDSGGPLMVPGAAGRFVLVGAVSFGVGCAFPTQYGVYSEVAGPTLRSWIEPRLNELSPPAPGAAAGTDPAITAPAAPAPATTTTPPRTITTIAGTGARQPGTRAPSRVAITARQRAALRRCLARTKRQRTRTKRLAARRRCIRPGRPAGVTARAAPSSAIILSFRAPGSVGRSGPAARHYLIKQSTRPITSVRSFRRAVTLCGRTCAFEPKRRGERLSLMITGLRSKRTYYYALKAAGAARRTGSRSRTARARTR